MTEKTCAKVIKVDKAKDGSIYLKCNSEKDSADILKVINTENKESLTATSVIKNNPQLRIVNITENINNMDLAGEIIKRNQLPENSVKIIYTYKQKNSNYAALIEVTSNAYKLLMKYKSICISTESCRIYDNFNIKRFKNCCGYNHSYKKCREKFKRHESCVKCSGDHNVWKTG